MRVVSLLLVVTGLMPVLHASTVRITVTGTVTDIHIDEGPVFGYRSRQHFPDNTPFTLTYVFDDERGETRVQMGNEDQILESGQSGANSHSPAVEAVLQIGDSVWDFGESVASEVSFNGKTYIIRFSTANKNNWISAKIYPEATHFNPVDDWRQSVSAHLLASSTSQFSLDNGTVSATGSLTPKQITVSGVDLNGQALSFKTVAGGANASSWVREWRLAKSSPAGGCIVESVTTTVTGTVSRDGAPITPYLTTHLKAWRVAPGATTAIPPTDEFVNPYPTGSSGSMVISATARFYEGISIPSDCGSSNRLSQPSPALALPANRATLPVAVTTTIYF